MGSPRTDSATMRASSNSSHASSRASRCRGSIAAASRGETLKNSASKSPTWSMGLATSCPSDTSSQNSPGLAAPGNLHATPIIATADANS